MSAVSRRLPGRLLQRLAARLVAAEVRERVVLPTLADFHDEWLRAHGPFGRALARLRGLHAFARVLVPAVVHAAVGHLRGNAWGTSPEDRHAARRMIVRGAFAALAVLAALLAQQGPFLVQRGLADTVVLLVPAMSAIAIPIGCLLGAAFASERRATPRVHLRPLLSIAALAGFVTFGVAGWLTPRANQMYRQRIFHSIAPNDHRTLIRGDLEMTFVELARRRSDLETSGDPKAAQRTALAWHKKPALGAGCLALAVAGAAIVLFIRSRAATLALAALLACGYFAVLRLAEQAADAGRLAPTFAMWAPPVVLIAFGLLILRARHGLLADPQRS